jgi:TctA family transporter
MFFGRPISLAIIALILVSLFYPLIRSRWLGSSRRKVSAD